MRCTKTCFLYGMQNIYHSFNRSHKTVKFYYGLTVKTDHRLFWLYCTFSNLMELICTTEIYYKMHKAKYDEQLYLQGDIKAFVYNTVYEEFSTRDDYWKYTSSYAF